MPDTTGAAADILSAAARLFAERGYKATTTRAIAEAAGVNEVTIFRRFRSKAGILAAIGESWHERMAGFAASRLDAALPVRVALTQLAELELAQASEVGALAMRLAMDARVAPEVQAWLSAGSGDNFAGLVAYLAEKQRAGEIRADVDVSVAAEAFFALTSGLVLSRAMVGGAEAPGRVPVGDAVHQALAIYLAGIGAA